jgi:hypothetical protein
MEIFYIHFSFFEECVTKGQIVYAIQMRRKMPVIPIEEIRQLLVGYIAKRFIEEKIGFVI